jgi:hypothetical protein
MEGKSLVIPSEEDLLVVKTDASDMATGSFPIRVKDLTLEQIQLLTDKELLQDEREEVCSY